MATALPDIALSLTVNPGSWLQFPPEWVLVLNEEIERCMVALDAGNRPHYDGGLRNDSILKLGRYQRCAISVRHWQQARR